MRILTNGGEGVEVSRALEEHIQDRLARAERRFGERVTRVEVFIKDVNGKKGGQDTVCTMEARPAGHDPIVVDATAEEAYIASGAAASKLEKALAHRLDKD